MFKNFFFRSALRNWKEGRKGMAVGQVAWIAAWEAVSVYAWYAMKKQSEDAYKRGYWTGLDVALEAQREERRVAEAYSNN